MKSQNVRFNVNVNFRNGNSRNRENGLILMTIYNFRCLYKILLQLKEHSAHLYSFRNIFVYNFWQLYTILDIYFQIFSCFTKIKNNQIK